MSQPLTFGRFKGLTFEQTPEWYQNWLAKQDWFDNETNRPFKKERPTHHSLQGWDGYSRKGQAAYDQQFEREKREADAMDSDWFNEMYGY